MSDINFDEVNEIPLPPATDSGDIGTSADDALAAWDDPLPPAGSQYDPSVGGVHYPNPEFMEGNYGGPERLG